jgi:hypothetical protein
MMRYADKDEIVRKIRAEVSRRCPPIVRPVTRRIWNMENVKVRSFAIG